LDGSEKPLVGTVLETLRRLYAMAAQATASGDTALVDRVISVINAGRVGNNAPAHALLSEQDIVNAACWWHAADELGSLFDIAAIGWQRAAQPTAPGCAQPFIS